MASCGHEAQERFRVCRHILENEDLEHVVRFTGQGLECEYLCRACVDAPELVDACPTCRDRATGSWQGIVGSPEIAVEPSAITTVSRPIRFAWPTLVDLQPLRDGDRNRWIGVDADATLYELDLDAGTSRTIAAATLSIARPMLRVSPDGTLAAVVERNGDVGEVIDLHAKSVVMPLVRDGYQSEHCVFPIAFFERDGRTLLVESRQWNRVDIVDPRTATTLTPRPSPPHGSERYTDYFHCGLSVSHDQRRIVDNGWVWHPVGVVTAWSLERWLEYPHEPEDGPSKKHLCARDYYWDGPATWLAGSELAIYGYGNDDEWMIPGVRIFDADTGSELRWFPGPRGDLTFDRELFAIDDEHGATVWNATRGTRLHIDPGLRDARYHPGAKVFVSITDGTVSILRGAGAQWRRGVVTDLAERIARDKSFEDLPVLGDALEAEGCTDVELLAHCHARAPHADRCWVLDRLDAAADR